METTYNQHAMDSAIRFFMVFPLFSVKRAGTDRRQ